MYKAKGSCSMDPRASLKALKLMRNPAIKNKGETTRLAKTIPKSHLLINFGYLQNLTSRTLLTQYRTISCAA
jgi:hypothetical protein